MSNGQLHAAGGETPPAANTTGPEKKKSKLREATKWVLLAIVGFLLGDAYNGIRDWTMDKPDYLRALAEEQKKEFAGLKESLGQISGSISSGDRAAFRQVQNAVKSIENVNAGLIQQLALAKQENETLRKVAGDKAGVAGGYDFILAANGGIRIDPATVLGLDYVNGGGARVNLTAAGQDRAQNKHLSPGESLAFRNVQGQSCRVSLISFNAVSPGTAAFAVGCT